MKEKYLTVIIGAGASYDCADNSNPKLKPERPELIPPITNQIIPLKGNYLHFHELLDGAKSILSEFQHKLNQNTTSFEKLLKEYKNILNKETKKELEQVPFFLQKLFGDASCKYLGNLTCNYDHLIRLAHRYNFDKILFLTTNYDVLIEKSLIKVESLNSDFNFNGEDSYIPNNKNWLLVKLHGSVNWGYRIFNKTNESYSDKLVSLKMILKQKLELDKSITILPNLKYDYQHNDIFYYPALTLPVEDKYEYSCPLEHINKAKEHLKICKNYLFIGFSGKDADVLQLIKDNTPKIDALKIISSDKNSAYKVYKRIYNHDKWFQNVLLKEPSDSYLATGGFAESIMNNEINDFLQTIKELVTT